MSQKTLGRACLALFIAMLIPLIWIALYNYPADDDFVTGLYPAETWLRTGSLWSVLESIVANTVEAYQTWQGNFVSTALFRFMPIIFGIQYYFLTSWNLLAILCLSVAYLVKGVTERTLHAGRPAFWIVYTAVMVLVLQFMPAIGYSVFWHNGGMYTVAACTLFLLEGVLLRCLQPQTRRRSILRCVGAALLGFMLGGSFFGPMLGAFTLVLLETVIAFIKKSKNRLHCAVALGFFTISMVVSILAPGNVLRQERTGQVLSPMAAVLTSVLDSFDLAGKWLTPQLLAALLLILPVMWRPLKESGYAFRHPLGVFVLFYGLFSATLVPGVFTGFGYTTERYMNAIYFYFLFMIIGGSLYAEGSLIRLLERERERVPAAGLLLEAAADIGKRFAVWYLAFCLALSVFGGFGYTIMNTSSISAAKSLLTGEAAQFRSDMAERQEYILRTDPKDAKIEPLASQPHVFKDDKLPWQGAYGRLHYMKWYFEAFEYAKAAREQGR